MYFGKSQCGRVMFVSIAFRRLRFCGKAVQRVGFGSRTRIVYSATSIAYVPVATPLLMLILRTLMTSTVSHEAPDRLTRHLGI